MSESEIAVSAYGIDGELYLPQKLVNAALATRDARIQELEAALKPFAAMHREEYTKDEIVLMRGIAEDMTVLHSHDFANAAVVLAAKDKP